MTKLTWTGTVTSVQPRIRKMRSFDERSHSYHGYLVRLDGAIDGQPRGFGVAIGPAARARHRRQPDRRLPPRGTRSRARTRRSV